MGQVLRVTGDVLAPSEPPRGGQRFFFFKHHFDSASTGTTRPASGSTNVSYTHGHSVDGSHHHIGVDTDPSSDLSGSVQGTSFDLPLDDERSHPSSHHHPHGFSNRGTRATPPLDIYFAPEPSAPPFSFPTLPEFDSSPLPFQPLLVRTRPTGGRVPRNPDDISQGDPTTYGSHLNLILPYHCSLALQRLRSPPTPRPTQHPPFCPLPRGAIRG